MRCIPPNTAFKQTRPIKKLNLYKSPTYVKSKSNQKIFLNDNSLKEIQLDIFDEDDNLLKIIGDFPGIDDIDNLIIQIDENNNLNILSKHSIEKKYEANISLNQFYKLKIFKTEMRNGIMTLFLEKSEYLEIPEELNIVFQDCLKSYPELEDKKITLKIVYSRRNEDRDGIDACKAKTNEEDIVLIFIPKKLYGMWEVFRPIIHHELCHFINLKNPDEEFYKRADKKSIELWDMLKKNNSVECKVDKKG